MTDESLARQREELIAELRADGIRDEAVLAAIRAVPRERFVLPEDRARAYANHPLPIGHGQTISQPYIVAFMTEAAGLARGSRVLEVGAGCGYQTAVLAEVLGLRDEPGPGHGVLCSIEIVPELAGRARATLRELGLHHVEIRVGDGYRGWPERAPFDAILVAAAPARVPPPLLEQLAVGGRLVIPVGDVWQSLHVVTRTERGFGERTTLPVRFVPMTGEAQREGKH